MADAFTGSLIGQAVGDALGFLIEGYGPDVAADFITKILKPCIKPIMLRLPQFTFGQYSDDTQLARETYISYIQKDGVLDPAHYACRIAMLFQPNAYRIVGYGSQTAAGAINIRNGVHHSLSGRSEKYKNSKGNGGAMRSAPIGLLYHRMDDAIVIERARTLSAITHASSRAMDGSALIALAAKYAITTRDQPFNSHAFLGYVSQAASMEFACEVLNLRTFLSANANDKAAAKHIIETGKKAGDRSWHKCISPGVTMTVLWSLYTVCRHPDSFIDAIALAMLPGGDVDTTSAIVGSIIGARVGLTKIPTVWATEVHDLSEWNYTELINLANQAHQIATK